MTVYNKSVATTQGRSMSLDYVKHSLPGSMNLPPVSFYSVSQGQRDLLPQINAETIFAAETLTLETWVQNAWGKHTLYTATPNSGDSLAYNALTSLWEPTPVNRPLLSQLRVYNDATNILEVKRVFSGNALTNTSGTTTGSMTPAGVHTLTGSTNKTYRITIDSAGTLDWTSATFKWSSDAGVTFTATAVAIATGTAAGRKVLAPILLDNGVSVQFGTGQFTAGDHWDFVAIASGNQVYDLTVDTTNSVVQVGRQIQIVDSNFFLGFTSTSPLISFDGTGVTEDFIAYDRTNNLWQFLVAGAQTNAYVTMGLLGLMNRTTPSTPAANYAIAYAKTDKPYWLDSGGVESILPQAAKAESITGTWAFSGTPTFTAATFTAATITTLTAPTIAGATTASGAWTFSAAATAVAITNNATVGGTLGVTGVTTVGTINGTAGTMTALTITTLTSTTITGPTSITLGASAVVKDSNGITRIAFATSSPHLTFTGNTVTTGTQTTGDITLSSAPGSITDSGSSARIQLATSTPHVTLVGDIQGTGHLGFGLTGAVTSLQVVTLTEIFTDATTTNKKGLYSLVSNSPTANQTTAAIYGVDTQAAVPTGTTKNVGDTIGVRGIAQFRGDGTATGVNVYGFQAQAYIGPLASGAATGALSGDANAMFASALQNSTSAGTITPNMRGGLFTATHAQANAGLTTITNLMGVEARTLITTANARVTNMYGVYVNSTGATAGTVALAIGLQIDAWTAGPTYTAQYGFSITGANSLNWAEGATEIGTLTAATRPTSIPAQLTVSQITLGNAVQSIRSVATNDDPTELVYQNRVTTTDGTATTLHTFTIPASTTYRIEATVVARRTGGVLGTIEDGAGYKRTATVKNAAGTATLIGVVAALDTEEDQALWDCTIDVTGATARIRVTGAAQNNVVWHTTARVYAVGT